MLLGVDVGGTFTDAVLVDATLGVRTAKVPTTPADEARGVLAAVRLVLDRAGAGAEAVERFAHGMTVATNALLEGRGARTALIATAGFTDVVELGRQARPHLYRLCEAAPAPLVESELRFAAPERMTHDGPLRALQPDDARALAADVAAAEPQAVAVCLLHSYADDSHERLLGELLEQALPQASLSLSCDLVGTFREYERTATTTLDAALSPLLAGYLQRLRRGCAELGLREAEIMQSSGGLTGIDRAAEHAALTVLSGPAGGVGGALLLAEQAGERDVLCFDMGGTSCDVCLIAGGEVPETAERTVVGRPLALPALDIHTVGAGGGSIAWRDPGGALRVGPQSAGADPGPACYGRGGERPTVTDANLLLGRLPAGSTLAGGIMLDHEAAARAVGALARNLELEPLRCALGIVRVAEAEMLGALRLMTVARGIDPRGFALLPFGGAGPLHAAALADALGIRRILCPGASGVLSALGLAAAPPRRDVSRTVLLSGETLTAVRLDAERRGLMAQARATLGTPVARARIRHELRYAGQSFELAVEQDLAGGGAGAAGGLDPHALRAAFADEHELRYGYRDDDAAVELVTLRASVWGHAPALHAAGPRGGGGAHRLAPGGGGARAAADAYADVVFAGGTASTLLLRGEPEPGRQLHGPALWALSDATLLVPEGWAGAVDGRGTIVLDREDAAG